MIRVPLEKDPRPVEHDPRPVKGSATLFHPDYIRFVLNENFEDAKAQFLAPLMAIHYAHLVMLAERGIISPADARSVRNALSAIPLSDVRAATFDGTCEDLFFYLERFIVDGCGEEAAGRLHTARSRNDIDMTMYRMQQREMVLALVGSVSSVRAALLDQAAEHRETIFAAHTHTQPAQPTTVAHYLLAVVEQLERDAGRLKAAYATTNRSPMGACAITGTGFGIDRQRVAALLGFDDIAGNTYGSIATVDYLLESVSAAAGLLAGLGRVTQDLLLWCTAEVGYLRLADGFVQCSSIMPQKRNPVALEHARAIASKAVGQAAAIVMTVHNTPFGDVVDTEDDLQPLVASMFADATRATALIATAMGSAQFNRERMADRARQGSITVTELADTLTREHDVPFKASHAVASRFAAETARCSDPPSAILREVTHAALGRAIDYDERRLQEILSPEYFVRVRTTQGGPAPSETAKAIAVSRERLASDDDWVTSATGKLREAEQALRVAAAKL
jgi:argininosuccinate lyase